MIIETERLYLRELEQTDIESLSKILQDEQTMYAYEGAFDDIEDIPIHYIRLWLFLHQIRKRGNMLNLIQNQIIATFADLMEK